ncbi:MAG: hypothetical protein IT564_08290 [Rhodospirillales bacterium]|nr:hypothetical protein [Rhodospirillales bacterium]
MRPDVRSGGSRTLEQGESGRTEIVCRPADFAARKLDPVRLVVQACRTFPLPVMGGRR